MWNPFGPVQEYWLDVWQRSILFLDVLRERGNLYRAHNAAPAPNVLSFEAELVRDGRTLPRPVNYLLARIVPPEGVRIDPAKPPFVVVDPRAGHGPGIGGMKQDSEIGVALTAGHACYFVGFLPEPMPGQTIEDVCQAEAVFIEEVAARHPEAEGKPVVIANCQAGWQTMIMAALNPDLAGPILLAGTPLSYWAGTRGKNPLRYLGGLLGGDWLTAFAGDIGGGLFDGASLVANFESLNPANTYWEKPYNVFSKVDTEAARFLDFETWWGSPVLLNAEEMEWITDSLFVGDKLSSGGLRTTDGVRIDLRNVKSPIIVFCSWGDNITPPQQALGWITDIYDQDRQIAANGQTIVYCLHQSIGHLGIFVSSKVATKEHQEFTSCMDMIDLAPPGLYEAVIAEVDEDTQNPELIQGRYLFRLERRTLDDVRALVGNQPEDDLRFAAVARISEINRALYKALVRPTVRALATPPAAEALRRLHPNRLRFAIFSDHNPLMPLVETLAKAVRERRAPAARDNPLLTYQEEVSSWITAGLKVYGDLRDTLAEELFLSTWGTPLVQAMAGLDARSAGDGGRHVERDLAREASGAKLRSDLEARFEQGGPMEAALRGLFYVRGAEGGFDERGFAALRALRAAQPAERRRPLAELKHLVKEQSLLFRIDEPRAMEAIPQLLPHDVGQRRAVLEALHNLLAAQGVLPEESRRRLDRLNVIFDGGAEPGADQGLAQLVAAAGQAPASQIDEGAGHGRH